MTFYIIGFMVLRLLITAMFFVGLYKIIGFARSKAACQMKSRENRGMIILKERLASGEIDEEKFRKMAAVLSS